MNLVNIDLTLGERLLLADAAGHWYPKKGYHAGSIVFMGIGNAREAMIHYRVTRDFRQWRDMETTWTNTYQKLLEAEYKR